MKKKGQAAETDMTSGLEDTEVYWLLMLKTALLKIMTNI